MDIQNTSIKTHRDHTHPRNGWPADCGRTRDGAGRKLYSRRL